MLYFAGSEYPDSGVGSEDNREQLEDDSDGEGTNSPLPAQKQQTYLPSVSNGAPLIVCILWSAHLII